MTHLCAVGVFAASIAAAAGAGYAVGRVIGLALWQAPELAIGAATITGGVIGAVLVQLGAFAAARIEGWL